MTTCRSYMSSPKEKVAKYSWKTCSRWQNTLIPMVNSNGLTYTIVVSVSTENTTDIYNHISPLILQVASVHLTMRGHHCIYYENIFTSCRRDHKKLLGPHALSARLRPVTWQTRNPYYTIGTVLKQASSWGDGSGIHNTRREKTYLLTFLYVHHYRIVNYIK
jgi:cytochrome c oxidase subunit IV